MPNVRFGKSRVSSYRTRTRTSANAARAKARKTFAPVKRIRRTNKRAPIPVKNYKSITALSRAVAKLQQQHWGDLQYQRQSCQLVSDGAGTSEGPTVSSPILFAVNNFHDTAPLYLGTIGVTAPGECSFKYPDDSLGPTNPIFWAKDNLSTAGPSILNKHNWMVKTNTDLVNAIQYKPVSCYYVFKVRVPLNPLTNPIYFKFTWLKTRKMGLETDEQAYQLPLALGAYNSLMVSDLAARRFLSKKYHHVLQEKVVKFDNKDIPGGMGYQAGITAKDTTVVSKTVTMKHQFGPKDLVRTDSENVSQASIATSWYKKQDPEDIIWCLISTNLPDWINLAMGPPTGNPPVTNRYRDPFEIEMYRYLKWRDDSGVWGGS